MPWWGRVETKLQVAARANGAVLKPMGWDEGGAHLYGLLWDRERAPRLGGVPRKPPNNRRAARGSGCWVVWGWRSHVSCGDRFSLTAPSSAPPAGGGASAAICFRLPVNYGRSTKAISRMTRREGRAVMGDMTYPQLLGKSPDGDTAGGGLASIVACTVLSYGMFLT